MRDRDLDLAKLQALKDLLLAQFHAKVSRWEDFQAAALGLAGLAFIAYFTKAMSAEALLAVLALAGGAILLAHFVLERYEGQVEADLEELLLEMERLKPGGVPG